ncbi:HAD family hydrolase [Enorma phocaeensis]|uniref:HAD family hydrolase n=1 Tax=Enorma phocaeensis TaxID=1871019 RepID=UPI000C855EA2|nr:HAD family hydrolase [Enorma phocaeensis]
MSEAAPQVKLILSDIDGTIMPAGTHCVSERTRAAFHAAMEAGLAIGPASGRGVGQIPAFFSGDAACCATCIATNGLEGYLEGERIFEKLLPHRALERLVEVLAEIPGSGLVVFEGTTPQLCSGSLDDLYKIVPAYGKTCEVIDGLPDRAVLKANAFLPTDLDGSRAFSDRLNAAVEGLDFDVPMAGFLNIMPAGWNKGEGVRELARHLGVSLNEVVVFGDAGNDLTMFAVAGHPVAVAGAMPEAAAAARWHIGRCEDDAVAAAIEVLAAGGWPFTA